MSPKVSVVMSVYNGERYLRQAIASILRQTWTDYEFLIVNDGSTDNSREIIISFDDPRIRLVDNSTNIGLTKSLNRGLELARGEFVARQDADDVSHPTRFEHQVSFLNAHPEVILVGAQARRINQYGHVISSAKFPMPLTSASIKWYLMMFGASAFIHTSVMFRREVVWDQFRGYDERFARAQDLELWSRVAQKYEVRNLSQVLVDYRSHPESVTDSKPSLPAYLHKEIILSNLRRFSGFRQIPTEWASLIYSFYTRSVKDPDRLVAAVDTVFSQFCALHSDTAVEQDIHRYLADQLGLIAYYSATYNRLASLRAFTRACRVDMRVLRRGIARRISIVKYFALWLGGEFIRRSYRRVMAG
jgi:glycosyltransferase involved in cell wall biosynthesis